MRADVYTQYRLKTLILKGTPSTLGETVVNLCAKNQVGYLDLIFSHIHTGIFVSRGDK